MEQFWRMVWEYEIPTTVMLTQCTEAGKVFYPYLQHSKNVSLLSQVKCAKYWPEKLHDSLTVEDKFRVTFSSNMPFAEYEFRKFKFENVSILLGTTMHLLPTLHYIAD